MDYNNYDRGYAEPSMSASDYMTRTYRWMALGLLITFAAAFVTATTPLFYVVNSLYLLFTIAELALVFVLSARVQNMSVSAARGVFLGYALLNFPCYLAVLRPDGSLRHHHPQGPVRLGSQTDDGTVCAA